MEQKAKSPEIQERFCMLSLTDGVVPKAVAPLTRSFFFQEPCRRFGEIEAIEVIRPAQGS